MNLVESKIAIVGLGYVGLPLAVEFARKYSVVGFDINKDRVNELLIGNDSTLEIDGDTLKSVLKNDPNESKGLIISSNHTSIKNCTVFIVTVPTPTDKYNRPVLFPLLKASETISKYLKKGDVVIYESTVYPGLTEEEMVPVLELYSGLRFNSDFFCGYSPERINPGDKKHTLVNVVKVTSGSTPKIADFVDDLYKSIIEAGTHKAPSIKVAEAAKVIENAQRDINIAFVNELSKIFNLLSIDTKDVLDAAGTKWNFLKFQPGLVGGHCIGVDPYYLAQKAQELGYHPEIILAGRRLNDSMGKYVVNEVIKLIIRSNFKVYNSKVLLMGFTFKENCPDIRNTRVFDLYKEFVNFNFDVIVYDPWANPKEVEKEFGINFTNIEPNDNYSVVVLAVGHDIFQSVDIKKFVTNGIIYDVKGLLPRELVNGRL